MDSKTLCGLNCTCDTLPDGKRLCVLAEPKSVRDARQREATDNARTESYDQAPIPEGGRAASYDGVRFTVVARVMHRSNKGEDRPHAVYGARGLTLDEAKRAAIEAGALGVFDELTYYPPSRVLTIRLSPDA